MAFWFLTDFQIFVVALLLKNPGFPPTSYVRNEKPIFSGPLTIGFRFCEFAGHIPGLTELLRLLLTNV